MPLLEQGRKRARELSLAAKGDTAHYYPAPTLSIWHLRSIAAYAPLGRASLAMAASHPGVRMATEAANCLHSSMSSDGNSSSNTNTNKGNNNNNRNARHSCSVVMRTNLCDFERTAVVRDMRHLELSVWWLCRKCPEAIPLTSIEFQLEGRDDVDLHTITSIPLCKQTVKRLLIGKEGNTRSTLLNLSWLASLTHLRELDLKSASVCNNNNFLNSAAMTNALANMSNNIAAGSNGGGDGNHSHDEISLVLPVLRQLVRLVVGDYYLAMQLPLDSFHCLRDVDMSSTGVGDADLAALATCSHLQRVILSGCGEIRHFAPLAKLHDLEILDVANTCMRDDCLKSVCAGCPHLTTLLMSGCWLVEDFTPLHGLEELTRLDVSQTRISALHVEALCATNTQLDALSLRSLPRHIQDFSPLLRLDNITNLDCSYTLFEDSALAHIAACPSLESISVRCNYYLEDFSALAALPNVRSLDVSGTRIKESDLLPILESCCKLEKLYVQSCQKIRHFFVLEKCPPTLQVLNVSDTCFDSVSLAALASTCGGLRSIAMHFCRRVVSLRSLRAFPLLTSVGLGCVTISYEDRRMLQELDEERGLCVDTQVLLLLPPF